MTTKLNDNSAPDLKLTPPTPVLPDLDSEELSELAQDFERLSKKIVKFFSPYAHSAVGTPMYQTDIALRQAYMWLNDGAQLITHVCQSNVDAMAAKGEGVHSDES